MATGQRRSKRVARNGGAQKATSASKQGKQGTEFPVGTVVWAHLPGYPSWPGKVVAPSTAEQRKELETQRGKGVLVIFYATDDFAGVPKSSIKPFDCPEAPRLCKKSRAKAFVRALSLARADAKRETAATDEADQQEQPEKRAKRKSTSSSSRAARRRAASKSDGDKQEADEQSGDDELQVSQDLAADEEEEEDQQEKEEEVEDMKEDEEQEEEKEEEEEEEEDQDSMVNSGQGMSDYEAQRLKNMQRNAEMLTMLNLQSASSEVMLKQPTSSKATKRGLKRSSSKHRRETLPPPRPRSRRLQGLDVDGKQLPDVPAQPLFESPRDRRPGPPTGDVPIIKGPLDDEQQLDDTTKATREAFMNAVRKCGKLKTRVGTTTPKRLGKLKLYDTAFAKVVPDRIFSVAFLPMADRLLVMTGDKTGHVGIFDPLTKSDECTSTFRPHVRPVSAIHVNPHNIQEVYTSSYEGVVRCFRPDRGTFSQELVFDEEEDAMLAYSDIDFVDKQCIYGCHGDGMLSMADLRQGKRPHIARLPLHERKISHVHVNPVQRNYIATCSLDKRVCVWDVRMFSSSSSSSSSKRGVKPVSSAQHSLSVSSVYFSPIKGDRLLSVGQDNQIKLWASPTTKLSCARSIAHNNNTGRWLSNFKAVWDPKCESYFAVGSMSRPRCMEFYDTTTGVQMAKCTDDNLGSVTSLLAFHPSLNAIAGGNSSGRLYVFCDNQAAIAATAA